MISSVGNSDGMLSSIMKETTAAQNVEFALIKKSQDLEKANGESALKLIASATAVTSSGGIDVHV